MSDSIIQVRGLSKSYNISHEGGKESYTALRDVLANQSKKIFSFHKSMRTEAKKTKAIIEEFWALNDVSFDIQQGDRLGIIGRNGAGKSTLLKILSRITEPTSGEIKIKGRIASLLEVGTGFHPELTGRENIYLNGAILGMSRSEIKRKFDEIVDFAEVEKFLDTPVKRYSSGMYVRLAFAVAAHLEPEILVVDEVLAVGDAQFQKKCLGKMQDVSKNEGRTVLFVSHNMAAINQLCTHCIALNAGSIDITGKTGIVVKHYLTIMDEKLEQVNLDNLDRKREGNKKVEFKKIWIKKERESENNRLLSIGENVSICFEMKFNNANSEMVKTAVEIKNSQGFKISNMIDVDSFYQIKSKNNTTINVSVILRDIRFYPDVYFLSVYAGDMTSSETYDYIEDCISFEVIDGGKLTNRSLPTSAGLLFLTPEWSIIP